MKAIASGFLACHGIAWLLVATYALYNAWLACRAWHLRHRAPERPVPPAVWPFVTVQLPIYNEVAVAPLLAAVAALDYPRDRLEIQVLDDSNDGSAGWSAELVKRLRARDVPIVHLHRPHREGYKAGALAAGLREARGSLLLLLDADFTPKPDLLIRLVPWFSDSHVGMVQARWGNGGADRNLLTRCAAYWIDRHFCIDQVARSRSGQFFHFNGSAGMWRRGTIEDAGGWQADTLAEDMDLSFRAWQRGWRFIYDHDVVVPAQIPPDATALRIQQERWACGTFQVAKTALPRFVAAGRWGHAAISFLHLTGYCFAMLLLLLALTAGLGGGASRGLTAWSTWCMRVPGLIFSGYFAARTTACWLAGGWRRALLEMEAAAVGVGLVPVFVVGAWAGLFRRPRPFHRTPKQAQSPKEVVWSGLACFELVLAGGCAASALAAARHGAFSTILLPILAAWGLSAMGISTMFPRLFQAAALPLAQASSDVVN